MEFSLLHAGLAGGAALAVIPFILHLILRQKPRHELFPALRLIRQRHQVNVRRLRVRHWLLLSMRMLLIALMALALARPSIHGASFIPDQQAPVAAALVFDTSLSMEYRERDRTRLEDAQEVAIELLREFPDGSEVIVLDSADPAAQFFPDLALARRRIESLRLRPRARSVNLAIIEACRALQESDRARKEIYVFTYLDEGSFALEAKAELQAALASVQGGVALCVLHVGVAEPKNVFLTELSASAEVIPANSELLVRAVVQDTGQGDSVVLELVFDQQPRGSQELKLQKGQAARAEFALPRLAPGVHQGQVLLRRGGGLSFDDTRYFTIEVRPVTRVLLVADNERDVSNLRNALAPPRLVEQQRARHRCDWIATERFAAARLSDYAVIFLVNVASLSRDSWSALDTFVHSGGGLGVILGDRVERDSYNQELAQDLLPLQLLDVQAAQPPVALQAAIAGHPAVRKLHEWDPAGLGRILVERYFRTELIGDQSRRVIDYSDGAVALAERTITGVRSGRVALLTTSISTSPGGRAWSDLPQSSVQFVILADSLTQHLAGQAEQRLNCQVGEDVILYPNADQRFGLYLLHTPDSDQPTRRSADPNRGSIVVAAPEALGNYRVTSGQTEQPFEKGFSLNPVPAESELAALSPGELDAVLGKSNYVMARTAKELREVMGDVRTGRELFPWLMLLLLLLFACEHLLANRFYRKPEQAKRVVLSPALRTHSIDASRADREPMSVP